MGRGPPAGLQDVIPGGEGGGKSEQSRVPAGGEGVGPQGRQRPGVQTPREMRVKTKRGEFPGGTLVKILCFHYRGHRFDPWSENQDPTCPALQPNEREKKKKDQGGRHKPEREGQRPRREDSKAQ